MTTEIDRRAPLHRLRRTSRQDDGLIYKMMAFVLVGLVVMPLAYALTSSLSGPAHLVLLLVALFVFDAGWDLAVLGAGRGEMLTVSTPRLILGEALDRAAGVGLVLLVFELSGDLRLVAGGVLVARILADVLLAKRDRPRRRPVL